MVNWACPQNTVAHSRAYEKSFNYNQTIYDYVHNVVYFHCLLCAFVTCSGCIAIYATTNGYNNQTIVSEIFSGMLNRYEISDTSRTDMSRLIRHIFVFDEKWMNTCCDDANLCITCHVLAQLIYFALIRKTYCHDKAL